ncbi:hypothetical protein [Methylobacterium sp. J-067]|uniref:hypothetical protein n=1 Tax=Methylobacterium sp. J-067 TaxID=2836648 RepID=UPI001FBB10B8|nr:hypothetical protein [Methylobacterium sp. J-067]MCJ2023576.1 hypothetical protein [Methylobacterium sp. J-067]
MIPEDRILRDGIVTSRSFHSCAGCPRGFLLAPGDRVHILVAIRDGRFETEHTCADEGRDCWRAFGLPLPPELGPDELAF